MKRVYNFFVTFTLAALMLSVASCAEDSAEDNVVEPNTDPEVSLSGDLVLTPSVDEVLVNNNSTYVEFTVFMGDTDVSDVSSLEIFHLDEDYNLTYVENLRYEITESGIHSFYATCNNSENRVVKSETVNVEAHDLSDLTLVASQYTILDGVDEDKTVEFSVFFGDIQITSFDDDALSIYYVEGSQEDKIDSFSYTIDAVGSYTFYAEFNILGETVTSDQITVTCIDWDSIDFYKRVFGIQFTATWCGYCPIMTAGIHYFNKDYSGEDRAIFASAHGSDVMSNNYSNSLINKMNISGFPTLLVGSVNANYTTSIGAYTPYTTTVAYLVKAVEEIEEQDVCTAISASSNYDSSNIIIEAKIAVCTDGEFGIGAMVLEDGITASQTSYVTLSSIGLGDYDTSNHLNVLQGIYPYSYSGDQYEDLGGVESHSSGQQYSFSCTFDISKLTSLSNIENCRIAVYTYNKSTGYIDNIVQAPIGGVHYFDTKN
ncbi:MAG: Omp28-related outer membrane protein [Rikenellaceae bacterium]